MGDQTSDGAVPHTYPEAIGRYVPSRIVSAADVL